MYLFSGWFPRKCIEQYRKCVVIVQFITYPDKQTLLTTEGMYVLDPLKLSVLFSPTKPTQPHPDSTVCRSMYIGTMMIKGHTDVYLHMFVQISWKNMTVFRLDSHKDIPPITCKGSMVLVVVIEHFATAKGWAPALIFTLGNQQYLQGFTEGFFGITPPCIRLAAGFLAVMT